MFCFPIEKIEKNEEKTILKKFTVMRQAPKKKEAAEKEADCGEDD